MHYQHVFVLSVLELWEHPSVAVKAILHKARELRNIRETQTILV